ncbi:MAG: DJ-1/PfpI family protein [Proteobacteria bacterium]|nr:DJ-1/PfpI family protein [Pseudomonadota bacterium]
MNVLMAIGERDFDPTEVAIPWKVLSNAGVQVHFATTGGGVGKADPRMLSGEGLGIWKRLLVARGDARDAYAHLTCSSRFQKPQSFEDLGAMPDLTEIDGLILPGGHAEGMIPYLESWQLQDFIARFFASGKPVGAICHGVIAVCRARNAETGRSVLHGRKTTALLRRQELLAWRLTRRKLGDYYRTYPVTVQDEVMATLADSRDFVEGPRPLFRDAPGKLHRGFTLRDGNYLSARWPGDAYKFATDFLNMLKEAP